MDFDGYWGTLARMYWPLMFAGTHRKGRCCVCGRPAPLNQHHYVWRSWGELHRPDGSVVEKPTITLCGSGNASGCHGLAHKRMLHFREVNGKLHYLLTDYPMPYVQALDEYGWRPIWT